MADIHRPDAPDGLDRLIDETIRGLAEPGPVDFRAKVLVRLDEAPEEPAAPFGFLLRPAWLAVAGGLFIVVGVASLWWLVDRQLGSLPGGRPATTVARAPTAASPGVGAARPLAEPAAAPLEAAARTAAAADDRRAFREAHVAASSVVADDDVLAWEPAEQYLPGAPAGNLGDPIAPLPLLPPIVIKPIVPAPIVVAPPVSELSTPVGATPIDDPSRGGTGPGRSGGKRP